MKTQKKSNSIIGIDLGDKRHAVCVIDNKGNTLKEFSISNRREDLVKLCEDYPKARVGIEVGTHSPWIARLLEQYSMDVVIANGRKLRAIYTNKRKCDKLDANMLARLVRLDPELLHPVQHGSEEAQRDLVLIKMRDSLVRQRVHIISSIRSTLKALGIPTPSSSCVSFSKTVSNALESQINVFCAVKPCLQVLDSLSHQIKQYDQAIAHACDSKHPQTKRLQQIPGVGPITSLAYVLMIEDPHRFKDSRDIGAYLGLIPARDQSGESEKQLSITKTGNAYLRRLLVQSAQYILGHWGPDSNLRRYGLNLASRGGKIAKKKAVVAVARKLSVLMLVLWKQQTDYDPFLTDKKEAA